MGVRLSECPRSNDMKTNPRFCRPLLQKLVLARLGEQDEAGLALCSLPLP